MWYIERGLYKRENLLTGHYDGFDQYTSCGITIVVTLIGEERVRSAYWNSDRPWLYYVRRAVVSAS